MSPYPCITCRKAPAGADGIHCEPCRVRKEKEAIALEERNRTVGCPDCAAEPGEFCITASGTPRPAHVARERAALRAAKGAA